MVDSIPIESYIILNGKKWIFIQSSMVIQCAYCIHTQALYAVRDDTGLVVSLKLNDPEEHGVDCPQRVGK